MAYSSSSPGLSTAALLAILACVATLLAVSALSLSLRRQKRDSLSPLEEDDVRENIITYDDEGGGEADTAAFDIAALQSAPHSSCRGYRTLDSRNVRYTQQAQDKAPGYRWASKAGLESQYPNGAAPLYGRLCYSSHTLPALRHSRSVFETGLGLAELACHYPPGPLDHSLVIQNQGAMGAAQDREADSKAGAGEASVGDPSATKQNRSQNLDWVQSESLPTDQTLVVTRSGLSAMASKRLSGAWACDTGALTGHRARQASPSPKQVGTGPPGTPDSLASTPSNGKDCSDGLSRSSGSILQGELHRDYPSSLGKGGLETGNSFMVARPPLEGSLPLGGTAPGIRREGMGYIPDWRNMAGYVLGRRDMIPQLLPVPGQNRGMVGQMAYKGGWGTEVGVGGSSSLAVRVGEFLKLRLAQVTFDPGQPPYDSVQVYGLEGEGSQAGSLSSLESEEEEKEAEPDWGGALEEWGPPFQRLAELFQEREREREEGRELEDEELGRKEEGERGQNAGGSRSEGH